MDGGDDESSNIIQLGKLSDTKCWRLSWPRKDVLNLRASVVNFQHEFFHIETQLIENGFFVVPRATSVSLSSFPTLKSEASLYVFSLSNCDIDRNICGTASVSKELSLDNGGYQDVAQLLLQGIPYTLERHLSKFSMVRIGDFYFERFEATLSNDGMKISPFVIQNNLVCLRVQVIENPWQLYCPASENESLHPQNGWLVPSGFQCDIISTVLPHTDVARMSQSTHVKRVPQIPDTFSVSKMREKREEGLPEGPWRSIAPHLADIVENMAFGVAHVRVGKLQGIYPTCLILVAQNYQQTFSSMHRCSTDTGVLDSQNLIKEAIQCCSTSNNSQMTSVDLLNQRLNEFRNQNIPIPPPPPLLVQNGNSSRRSRVKPFASRAHSSSPSVSSDPAPCQSTKSIEQTDLKYYPWGILPTYRDSTKRLVLSTLCNISSRLSLQTVSRNTTVLGNVNHLEDELSLCTDVDSSLKTKHNYDTSDPLHSHANYESIQSPEQKTIDDDDDSLHSHSSELYGAPQESHKEECTTLNKPSTVRPTSASQLSTPSPNELSPVIQSAEEEISLSDNYLAPEELTTNCDTLSEYCCKRPKCDQALFQNTCFTLTSESNSWMQNGNDLETPPYDDQYTMKPLIIAHNDDMTSSLMAPTSPYFSEKLAPLAVGGCVKFSVPNSYKPLPVKQQLLPTPSWPQVTTQQPTKPIPIPGYSLDHIPIKVSRTSANIFKQQKITSSGPSCCIHPQSSYTDHRNSEIDQQQQQQKSVLCLQQIDVSLKLYVFLKYASNKVIHESVDKYLQINEPQSSEKRLSREDALSSVRKSKIFADDKLLLFLQDLSSQHILQHNCCTNITVDPDPKRNVEATRKILGKLACTFPSIKQSSRATLFPATITLESPRLMTHTVMPLTRQDTVLTFPPSVAHLWFHLGLKPFGGEKQWLLVPLWACSVGMRPLASWFLEQLVATYTALNLGQLIVKDTFQDPEEVSFLRLSKVLQELGPLTTRDSYVLILVLSDDAEVPSVLKHPSSHQLLKHAHVLFPPMQIMINPSKHIESVCFQIFLLNQKYHEDYVPLLQLAPTKFDVDWAVAREEKITYQRSFHLLHCSFLQLRDCVVLCITDRHGSILDIRFTAISDSDDFILQAASEIMQLLLSVVEDYNQPTHLVLCGVGYSAAKIGEAIQRFVDFKKCNGGSYGCLITCTCVLLQRDEGISLFHELVSQQENYDPITSYSQEVLPVPAIDSTNQRQSNLNSYSKCSYPDLSSSKRYNTGVRPVSIVPQQDIVQPTVKPLPRLFLNFGDYFDGKFLPSIHQKPSALYCMSSRDWFRVVLLWRSKTPIEPFDSDPSPHDFSLYGNDDNDVLAFIVRQMHDLAHLVLPIGKPSLPIHVRPLLSIISNTP